MTQILLLLQLAVSLLVAAQTGTSVQKDLALSFALQAVQIAQEYQITQTRIQTPVDPVLAQPVGVGESASSPIIPESPQLVVPVIVFKNITYGSFTYLVSDSSQNINVKNEKGEPLAGKDVLITHVNCKCFINTGVGSLFVSDDNGNVSLPITLGSRLYIRRAL